MAFQAHSYNQYLTGLHFYWCKGATLEAAAEAAHMHPTVLWRAATGWTGTNGRDGHAGRAAFLAWLKGLRSDQGAPCCGAVMVAGERPLPILDEAVRSLDEMRENEAKLEQLTREIAELREKLHGKRPAAPRDKDAVGGRDAG